MTNRNVSSSIGSGMLLLFVIAATAAAFVTLDVPASLRAECQKQNLPFCEAPPPVAKEKTQPINWLTPTEMEEALERNEALVRNASDTGMNTTTR